MTASASPPFGRWMSFAALSLLFFVVSAGAFSSLGVVLPAMVSELKWSWTEAGLGYTLLGLACGFASIAPAVLIRRIGVRGAIGLGVASLVAGFGVMAVATSVTAYLAATLLIGIAFALCTTVPGTHILTDLFVDRRSTVLGAYFTIGALGGVAGPLLYVVVQALTHGWRPYWWTFVALALGSGLMTILSMPKAFDESRHRTEAPEQVGPGELIEGLGDFTVRRALATPQFYVIVGGYTTYLLINTTAHGFAVAHLTERGVSANDAAFMLSVEALIGAGIGLVGGVVGEKVSSKTLMLISLVGVTVGMAGLGAARDWLMMWIYAWGVGIGFGLSFIASTMLLLTYFGKKANLELYSIMCLISTTAALGPAFGGWARDMLGSFSQLFYVCAIASLMMLGATVFLRPPAPAARGVLPATEPGAA